MTKAITVEQYIAQHYQWGRELNELRNLFLTYELEENIKWGAPVYMKESKNLFGLVAFKNHYAIWFFQGGLLEENTTLLVNAQEGKTQAMRQIRFDKSSNLELTELAKYIDETISKHKQGRKIDTSHKKEVVLPELLKCKLENDREFEKAFKNLTPGKQREYSDFISQAKSEETRQTRLKKSIAMILAGIGLNDKYKNC